MPTVVVESKKASNKVERQKELDAINAEKEQRLRKIDEERTKFLAEQDKRTAELLAEQAKQRAELLAEQTKVTAELDRDTGVVEEKAIKGAEDVDEKHGTIKALLRSEGVELRSKVAAMDVQIEIEQSKLFKAMAAYDKAMAEDKKVSPKRSTLLVEASPQEILNIVIDLLASHARDGKVDLREGKASCLSSASVADMEFIIKLLKDNGLEQNQAFMDRAKYLASIGDRLWLCTMGRYEPGKKLVAVGRKGNKKVPRRKLVMKVSCLLDLKFDCIFDDDGKVIPGLSFSADADDQTRRDANVPSN
mmetsp:Transcript_23879/g.51935  ORF Transcript_23879/g.51935 Transcript_23879/m.51935 type:complete len:305 (-) Transcript_23879:80-994(-)